MGARAIQTLQTLPVAPGVPAHSIISVASDGPAERGDDGVAAYASAHVDGVESERVVRSGHSTQGHPDTIAEVHRILLLHAASPWARRARARGRSDRRRNAIQGRRSRDDRSEVANAKFRCASISTARGCPP